MHKLAQEIRVRRVIEEDGALYQPIRTHSLDHPAPWCLMYLGTPTDHYVARTLESADIHRPDSSWSTEDAQAYGW